MSDHEDNHGCQSEEDNFDSEKFDQLLEEQEEIIIDSRHGLNNEKLPNKILKTSPILTEYEKTAIIGKRAEEIQKGAPIFIKLKLGEDKATDIATRELKEGLLPMSLKRKLPNGDFEIRLIQELQGRKKNF